MRSSLLPPVFKKAVCLACLACLPWSAVRGDPAPPNAAEQLFAQGQFEPARQAFAASAAAAPADPGPQISLIRTLLRLDRWEEAVVAAQAFTAKFPNNADAHGLLALTLIRAGWQAPYADEAAKSLALDPQDYWGLLASGRAADWDGKSEEARRLFRQASGLHPERPDAWADLFLADDDRGHVKEQLTVAEAYVKLNPQGHPHDEICEDAKDLLAHAASYQAAFETDPPYQHDAPAAPTASNANASKSAAAPPSTLTIEFLGDYAVFPVTIDGTPFHLLFDTGGGDDILLSWKAARRLNLPVVAHSYVRGVSGKEKSDTLKAKAMTLAGLAYKSIKIETAEGLDSSGDGILGGDILRDCVMTLDLDQRTATLVQAADAAAPLPFAGDQSVALPFHFYHGDLYVQLEVNTLPVWTLVDTGAYETTLSLRLARQQLKSVASEDVHSGTYNGRRGIGNTDRSMEYIASRAQSQITLSQNPPVAIPMETIGTSDLDREVSPSADCDFEVGLWLGMSSFTYARRLTFDYPRRLLTFEYTDPDAVLKAGLPAADKSKAKKK